jgi:hypothetical protein
MKMRRPAVKRLRLEEQRSLSNQLIASNPWASLAWIDLAQTTVSSKCRDPLGSAALEHPIACRREARIQVGDVNVLAMER